MEEPKKAYWHNKQGLKQVSGFLKPKRKALLRKIAKDRTDLSLTRYVTRLLEKHIDEYLAETKTENNP